MPVQGDFGIFISHYILNGLSIVCSVSTIVIVLWVWKKYPAAKESPSFNLTPWIAAADIPLRIVGLISIPINFPNGFPDNQSVMRFLSWLSFFGMSWFIYLTCMITLDLQLVFFHHLPRQARIRRWYPAIGFAVALLISIPYPCLPIVRTTSMGFIQVGIPSLSTSRVFFVWTTLWMNIGFIYSLSVVIAVFIKLSQAQSRLRQISGDEMVNTMSRPLIRNAYLIIAYPMVLFVMYVPYSVVSWVMDSLERVEGIRVYWFISTLHSTQGIVSLAIVLFHPIMLHTYRKYNLTFHSLWSSLSFRFSKSTITATSCPDSIDTHPLTDISDSTAHYTKVGNHKINIPMVSGQCRPMDKEVGRNILTQNDVDEGTSQTVGNGRKLSRLEGMLTLGVDNQGVDEPEIGFYHAFNDPACL